MFVAIVSASFISTFIVRWWFLYPSKYSRAINVELLILFLELVLSVLYFSVFDSWLVAFFTLMAVVQNMIFRNRKLKGSVGD